MSMNLSKSVSEVEEKSKKNEATKRSVWFQTAAGELVELEYELGWQSPLICKKLKCGVGAKESSPIYLDENVNTKTLELIFGYFRFHQATGHSDKECKLFMDEFLKKDTNTLCRLVHAATFLQLEELSDMICRALARNIQNSSPKVKEEFFTLCEKSAEATKRSVWFQTAAGELVELEYELGWQSPLICEKLKCGVGAKESSPIYLDENVNTKTLELIFGYFRFHQATGHSDKECKLFMDEFLKKDTNTLCRLVHAATFLQLEELSDMICRALARNIQNSSPKVKEEFFTLCEKSAELMQGEELNLQENVKDDLRIRLTKKLAAKQKKVLDAVESAKKAEAEVEAEKKEDRSIDDLISFINGDTKVVQTSKKKKKNRNGEKAKEKISSSSAL